MSCESVSDIKCFSSMYTSYFCMCKPNVKLSGVAIAKLRWSAELDEAAIAEKSPGTD